MGLSQPGNDKRRRPQKRSGRTDERGMDRNDAGLREAADRPGLAARQVAARLLSAVVDSRTSLDGLTDPVSGHPQFRQLEPRDRSLVKAILVTALRFRGTVEAAIAARIERPLPPNAARLKHVLHVGAAQILFLDVPDSAAVDLAVASAAADPRSARFAALVNAVLRRLAREKQTLGEEANSRRDCPEWLLARLVAQYGEERAAAIAAAHRQPAPLDLTVVADPEGWADRLGGRVVAGSTVRLSKAEGPVSELPGFAEGAWFVQDAAAALPARLLGDVSGKRVADLCAAPGGKTAQLCLAGARVTALDISASRMKRLEENLKRLSLTAETRVTDLADFEAGEGFDAILLDAPCSSTGTIRRHPDVAHVKDAAEVEKLAGVQARLLREAARMLKPGGTLVFSNCSLDREEGEAVVEAFLDEAHGFTRAAVRPEEVPGLAGAVTQAGDLRTTPDMLGGAGDPGGGIDGFFAARLRRH